MRDRRAAARFARAFFDDARERNAVEQAAADMQTLKAIWHHSPELAQFLAHPLVPADQKKELCREHLGPRIQAEQMLFVDLLIDRQRTAILPDLADVFQALVDDHFGVTRAGVWSAVPLTDEERERLRQAVALVFGGEPVLKVAVHPELIGGVTVRVKDSVLDGSVRTSLAVLRADLQAVSIERPAPDEGSED